MAKQKMDNLIGFKDLSKPMRAFVIAAWVAIGIVVLFALMYVYLVIVAVSQGGY